MKKRPEYTVVRGTHVSEFVRRKEMEEQERKRRLTRKEEFLFGIFSLIYLIGVLSLIIKIISSYLGVK